MSDTPKFLLDENIPKLLKKFLESKDFSAEYALKGIRNSKLASVALEKKYILVSRDRDFLDPVLFPPHQFPGIIVLIPHPPKIEKLIKGMDLVLSKINDFKGKVFIVDEKDFEVNG